MKKKEIQKMTSAIVFACPFAPSTNQLCNCGLLYPRTTATTTDAIRNATKGGQISLKIRTMMIRIVTIARIASNVVLMVLLLSFP